MRQQTEDYGMTKTTMLSLGTILAWVAAVIAIWLTGGCASEVPYTQTECQADIQAARKGLATCVLIEDLQSRNVCTLSGSAVLTAIEARCARLPTLPPAQ
jgi:hypothetical protein